MSDDPRRRLPVVGSKDPRTTERRLRDDVKEAKAVAHNLRIELRHYKDALANEQKHGGQGWRKHDKLKAQRDEARADVKSLRAQYAKLLNQKIDERARLS